MTVNKLNNLFYLLLPLLLCACSNGAGKAPDDYTQEIYTPGYASSFSIKGAKDRESVIITTSNPWQGAENVATQLFISRNGEQPPAGFTGQVLSGDAKRVVAMSSTHIAMLDAVGATDAVVGVSGLDYISNPKMQARHDSVADVGYEGNVNYELLISLHPDIVLLYSVNSASPMEAKLRELGIPFMYIGDYLEQSPLGKAEWLVAVAELTGRREEGINAFSEIPTRYDALKQKVAGASSAKPTVMVNTPYADVWNMPSSQSYQYRLIVDAGGVPAYSLDTGSTSAAIDLETAYKLASSADVWINPGQCTSLGDVSQLCPKFADVRCLSSGNVYNSNLRSTPSGGNDYFESAVVHPDIVLRDLVKIFHPELISEDFFYYKKLE